MTETKTIGFIGNFQVPYTTENDRKWSFEKLGHTVIPFQENQTSIDTIMDRIGEIDVLFYSHTHGWGIPGLKELFLLLKTMNKKTASVHLDRWAWLEREKDIGTEATWFTEYQFMADASPEAKTLYTNHHLNWHWIQPGVVERDCYIATPDRVRFPHDVIFVGSRGYHPEYPGRPQLIDFLHQTYGNRFGHYGNDGLGVMRGHDLNVLYASAQIVVGDSCFGGRPGYWSDRVPETIGRGGFLLHPECTGLDIPGIYYTAQDFHKLKGLIDLFLVDEQERERIRLQAHKHVKEHDTYTNRAQQMLDILFTPTLQEL